MTDPYHPYGSTDPVPKVPVQPPAPPAPAPYSVPQDSVPQDSVPQDSVPQDSVPPVSSAPPTLQYPGVTYPPVSGTPAPLPVPYAPPAAAGYGQPAYGSGVARVDPLTGQLLSDKSKVTAGLLQLVLGFLFTLGGVGRLYAGNTTIGVIQIVATVIAWSSFWCGFFLFIPFIFWAAIWVWFVIDGIVMLAGRPLDGQGRLLRS
jgi:TM2 domain-containing membrane protein YozV